MKRQIKKETLKEIIRLYRKYWKIGDIDILGTKSQKCEELSIQAFGNDNAWSSIGDIVSGITSLCCHYGMNITYETIYKVFELLGFEIVEENEINQKFDIITEGVEENYE